jgi:hypothetical protein
MVGMSAPARLRLARPASLELRQKEKGKRGGSANLQTCNWTFCLVADDPSFSSGCLLGSRSSAGGQQRRRQRQACKGSPVRLPGCCQTLLQASGQLSIPDTTPLAASLARLAPCASAVLAALAGGALI